MKYRISWKSRYDNQCGHSEKIYSDRSIAQAWADQANDTDCENEYTVEMVSDAGEVASMIIETQKDLTFSRCIDWDFSLN